MKVIIITIGPISVAVVWWYDIKANGDYTTIHQTGKYHDIHMQILDDNDKQTVCRKVSNIRSTLVGNKIVDHSDVVGASPVGAAPTSSSFSI